MTKQPNAAAILKAVKTKSSAYWERIRQARALSLFHHAAEQVPAYRNFLRKHKIDPSGIKKFEDLRSVPLITKNNYLRQYSLPELSWDGTLDQPLVYTSTSGSTGKPIYFHRSFQLDWQSSLMHELYYTSGPAVKGPTLVVVCFGMGVWIGGLITYQAFRLMKERGHNLSVVTPGINKEEIFRALKNLAPLYAQTIIVGYPPFIKDVIDEAEEQEINLKKLKLRILCAAEPFTDKFRHYLAKKAGADPATGVLNIYGTADLGTMAMETPLSVAIREAAVKRPELFKTLFGDISKTPTLCQYVPEFISFDLGSNQEILITGNNSIPLVRYAIGDHGGVYTADEMESKLKSLGLDMNFDQRLPFVYVYERIDMSTKLYGAIIYPEHIRVALQDGAVDDYLTGKFTMSTKYSRNLDQYLEIVVELKKNVAKKDVSRSKVRKVVMNELLHSNAEFRNNYNAMGSKVIPKIILKEYGHPVYFKSGIKQKWVKK